MKKIALLISFALLSNFIFAHDINNKNEIVQHFNIDKQHIDGYFIMLKDDIVYIETDHHELLHYPLSKFSKEQQQIFKDKYNIIAKKNAPLKSQNTYEKTTYEAYLRTLAIFLLFSIVYLIYNYFSSISRYKNYIYPIMIIPIAVLLISAIKISNSITDPIEIDKAFIPFKPNIFTRWDENWFYVESKGIPTTHQMMVGISNHGWQRQVPIPQCYIDQNAWQIPLNPVMATNPIPVDSIHFTRGAIALAVNGVPIFNVHTNTGVDSYLDGQLDNFGGHCGRADDYHYHTAPLHLYDYTTSTFPIAFALDGFAVYGSVEPDGTPMQTLDTNHGHFYNNNYHYHGTANAPYMIAKMAGVVTEDGTHQLVPQAAAHPVRPSLTPLNGALITSCTPNITNNGYNLTYTRNGLTDSVVYNWNANGLYTFGFYTDGSLDSTRSYNGFTQCNVPITSNKETSSSDKISIYPNPVVDFVNIDIEGKLDENDVKEISIYTLQGKRVFSTNNFVKKISMKDFSSGNYIINVQFKNTSFSKKIVKF